MSGQKSANPCNKFQANIFYKSKCQNCFKSRELHLPTDHGKDQAKPIYGGWLCLAAEGTDFDNPIQRSRKWQRRFFILYEHGSMSFALDELTSTLPQGTVNMNLCTAVIDAEPKTGQRNALCIITPEQEFFIRGENKEIINGWSEQLVVYPRTYKQNQNKKRKVEPTTSQEPSPAKMAATEPSFSVMKSGDPRSSLWQGERPSGGPDVAPVWTVTDTDPLGLDETSAGHDLHYLPSASSDSLTFDSSLRLSNGSCISSSVSSLDSVASEGTDTSSNSQPTEPTPYRDHPPANKNNRAERSCYNEPGKAGRSAVGEDLGQAGSRKGRSEARSNQREKLQSCGDLSPGQLTVPPPQRRAKSLDRRTSESVMTPDLLNFKKGWMMKLDKEDQWRKCWFVLSADSLRYYKDSFAEENSDLEGEIDLTKCHNVSEYQVQRNYGFQIHTQKCVFTLSAMTAGIRRNWIQALMKNVHPSNAPDVASLPVHRIPCSPTESLPLPKPDVTQDSSPSSEVPTETVQGPKQSHIHERRREGRSKTFDWTEFSPMALLASEQEVQQETKEPLRMEVGDLERKRRREERRRRYDSMLGFLVGWEMDCDRGGISPRSPRTHQKVQREIEQCWQQVERTAFRQEKTVPLYTESQGKDKEDMGILLETYHRRVEELKGQLAKSDHRRLELKAQLSTALGCQHHASLPLEAPMCPEDDLPSLKSLTDMYRETRELLQQQELKRQNIQEQLQEQLGLSLSSAPLEKHRSPGTHPSPPPSIWLHDTEGNLQELEDLFPDCPISVNTPVMSPTSDTELSSDSVPQNGSENRGQNLGSETSSQTQFENGSHQQTSIPESHTKSCAWSPDSLSMEETQERANSVRIDNLLCCETTRPTEEYVDPDQAIVMRRLSQEVELLSSQNEALNQHNQEMLNQLTEADREIERLNAELIAQYSGPQFLREAEQHSQTKVEGLEKELRRRDEQLQEAQSLLASMDQRLKETEVQLQLREDTFKDLGFPAEEDDDDDDEEEEAGEENINTHHLGEKEREHLQQCLQAMEAKQLELERQLQHTEQTCRELQAHNTQLREAERLYSQRAMEAEADIVRINEEVEKEWTVEKESGLRCSSEGKWQEEVILDSGEERVQQVVEGIRLMSRTLGRVAQVIDRSDMDVVKMPLDRKCVEVNQTVVRQLQLEEEFWGRLLNSLKVNPSQSNEDKLTDVILSQILEHMVVEKQTLLLAHSLFSHNKKDLNINTGGLDRMNGCRSLRDLDIIGNIAGESGSEMKEEDDDERIWNVYNQHNDTDDFISRHFTEITQERIFLLNQIASSVGASANDELQSLAQRLCHFHNVNEPRLASIHCTAMEAFSSYRLSRLNTLHKSQFQETQQGLLIASSPLMCSRCAGLLSENQQLGARLSVLERQGSSSVELGLTPLRQGEHIDSQQTATQLLDTASEQKTETPAMNAAGKMEVESPNQGVTAVEEVCRVRCAEVVEGDFLTNSIESPMIKVESRVDEVESRVDEVEIRVDEVESRVDEVESRVDEVEKGIQEVDTDKDVEERSTTEPHEEANTLGAEELEIVLSSLRGRVKDLEEQLSVMANIKAEHDGRMASLQLKHKEDIEKLKATYEHGFVTMEESQQRIVGELQHRHQQDLQRLQLDTDRLLEEETAATITAIEAMKNAHCAELKREIQRACHENNNAGDMNLGEICRQHSEELASCHRELEVLSQQYSLKCLESSHLSQALEAERQALCQCQQENQDLRTRNQELSGHLAAEITRLCSLAKQNTFPLSQERDVYELEISLRVKESEVQCLKQKITSLKDELQTAHRDKRYATETYKDIYTELSIMRAKAERDLGQLRENLRLAHKALGELSPAVDTDNNECQGR
ncbi:myosin phosphatase Rho-interacting protein isoform X2 [Salmo trutta]|uniref:myosin phosphatase Rho-interacting protein isoform X2 n=1 Tax=Salmo trutta TaxID=8032 RepID=UPI001131B2C2|nr:myosin phosphatase Rho-interacting protein-like isoform X2 [Salmo trutta]